ncbi:MAG: HD domain-containing protein [Candidatus Woesearchaeota archaeon]|jgi:GTP pyrophosphokinase
MDKEGFIGYGKSKDYSKSNLSLFEKAIDYASLQLGGSKRLSGNSYLEHNLRVGYILMENGAAPEVVLAGILHGLLNPEDEKKIKSDFNLEVWHLVSGLQEIEDIKSRNMPAEVLKKVLLTTLKDVRVILIKLANKLDNLRTISVLAKDKQQTIAQEVLDIYAPLAYRLGVEKLRIRLEDEAFKILNPKKYVEIENFLKESSEQREKDIADATELVKKNIGNKVTLLKIKGRSKHIYSIFKKMSVRGVPLNEQYDLYGIRILVPEEKDCYTVLGLLHENFDPIEGRLKDYIAKPKPNFYRSIHTGLKLPNDKILEVQIRTPEMDEFAEEGIAAHWKYKGISSEASFEKKVSWLKGILDLQKNEGDKEFLEAAKVDIFGDNIYCYTPKGDVKELPLGSTVLDFAFAVHEEVGHHAVGGRINGKFVPLRSEVKKGDVVEVVTNKNQRPHRSWLKIVRSTGSRQKIRKFLREVEKLPDMHYRLPKQVVMEEQGVLTEAKKYPTALCLLAKCCSPLPGDEVVGFITKRRVISVHLPECRAAVKEKERWINVEWKNSFAQKIKFYVVAFERSGLLADLLHTIATAHFEVKEAKAKLLNMGEMECSFLVVPRDLDFVKEMVRRVRKVKGVKKIYFE